MFSLLLLRSALTSFDPSAESDDAATPTPPQPAPTAARTRAAFTAAQRAIVWSGISVTVALIVAEGAVTVYCRRQSRRAKIPLELDQVMLPSPDDSYGPGPI
jgi:hypothetical protein